MPFGSQYPSTAPHRKRRRSRDSGLCGHALTFCTHGRRPELVRPEIASILLRHLDSARREQHFELFAYVVMPEHVHLAVAPLGPEFHLSKALRAIKYPTARDVFALDPTLANLMHVPVAGGGHQPRFWLAGGGYSRQMESADAMRTWIGYVHDNPRRRGLVAKADEWRWSSAAEFPPIEVDPFHPWE
ncbi:MAG: transposase [Fimbriimonadaceae bacterium]